MSDIRSDIDRDRDERAAENKLLCDGYADFLEALDILYIRGNLSARILFLKNWPAAARYIFGEELIAFDTEGIKDRQRLAELENEAEARREALLQIVSTLEAKSLHDGLLQLEYVEGIVRSLGRDLALLMYAEGIVNRFVPVALTAPLLEEVEEEVPAVPEPVVQAPAPPPVLEPHVEKAPVISPVPHIEGEEEEEPKQEAMTFMPSKKSDDS